jgi:2-polyprenyl-3-methyl-5-hydroxy-6-metoxy-1,4-benzoquinol methylase
MAGCCDTSGYGQVFNEREARRALRSFRRRGLDSTAGPMVGALAARGIEGATVLEVGAGIGTAQVALLKSGAARSVAYDLSPAYEQVSAELLTEHGVADRVEWHTGDFLANGDGIDRADVVFLNRVVCCYPHMAEMVDAAAGRARRLLALSYPRDRWWLKAGLWVINGFLRLRRTSFRVFVHDTDDIARRVEVAGLSRVASGSGVAWEWHVWERPA